MADLARLRHMLLSPDRKAILLASLCHHTVPDPTDVTLFDYKFPPLARDWFLASPFPLFGPCVPQTKTAHDAITLGLDDMSYDSLDLSSVIMRNMRLADNPFAKTTRGETTSRVATSQSGAAQHAAQSPLEFATYDCLRDAGYVDIKDATSRLQSFLTQTNASVHVTSRQLSRNRSASFFLFTRPGDSRPTAFLTPFFTSREATRLFLAIVLRDDIISHSIKSAATRGVTVLGYAARASLDAVRRVVEPAQSILDNYSFDSHTLAFLDENGQPAYLVTDRTPSVVVAYSRVFSGGNVDICTYASQLRTEVDVPGGPQGLAFDYFQASETVPDTIRTVAAVLDESRVFRNNHEGGHELNKDGGLGYFARDRGAKDRNTAACVTRVEEVAALQRSLGRDVEKMVFVVEWGGKVNYDVVLAATALTGATSCVDVGTGGFKIGESSEKTDIETDDKGAYVCLIPKADTRGLPRMPIVGYEPSDSVTQRLDKLLEFVTGGESLSVAYISGGATMSGAAPADVIGNTLARLSLLSHMLPHGSFFCGDALIPPICAKDHSDHDCLDCAAFDYSASAIGDECSSSDVSLVKPRASYAHNTHFSIEWVENAKADWSSERTLIALDAVVATNVARNANWGDLIERDGSRRPSHPAYGRVVKDLLDRVYRKAAEGSSAEVGATRSIVKSLAGML
nr:hypothetical protein [Alternaria alternata polymycovirus 2]